MIVYIPVLVCLIGLLAFALSKNGDVRALALHMFWVGLLATLLHLHQFHIVP